MSEISNLETLTAKIYREGIEKADKKSLEIIHKAEEKAKDLVDEANAEADRIRIKARQEAEAIRRSCESELQLKGNQVVHDLKQQLLNTLNEKIIDPTLKESFEDPEFIRSLILETVKHWNSSDELEVELPASLEDRLDKAFKKSISDHLDNLEISFSKELKGGFRIMKKGEAFRITFTDEAFGELFKNYLGEKTRKIIFR